MNVTNVTDTLVSVLSNTSLWGAILSTVIIISLGYILVKVKVFKTEWKNVLNSIVLKVALPALAFTGFMNACKYEDLSQQGIILGVAFGFYIVLLIIAQIWVKFFSHKLPRKLMGKKNVFEINESNSIILNLTESISSKEATSEDITKRALVMWMMLIFGSTTFFGMPIIKELYANNGGLIAANLWNIPYRIFLYSFCFLVMAGLKFNKQNIAKSCKTALLNPIVIATFIGLICWLTQLIPGAAVFGTNFEVVGPDKGKGWFQWSTTMPYLHKPLATIGGLSSPLVWLSIGITLSSCKIKDSVKDKWVWVFSLQKLLLIPLLVFGIMLPLVWTKLVSQEVAISMVIFAATPPATVVVAYSMQYKLCEKFAAQCSALTTLLAIITLPLWIIASKIVFSLVVGQ